MLEQPMGSLAGAAAVKKTNTTCFRNIALFITVFMYAGMMSIVLRPYLSPLSAYGFVIAATFNVVFGLFFISFIRVSRRSIPLMLQQSSNTDPGAVPTNWGFYMGDDTKRRRYCKVCNVWKPDRTHHCSACNRCRKCLQRIVHGSCSVYYLINESMLSESADDLAKHDSGIRAIANIYVCVMVFVGLALIFALIPFVQFHFKLVLKNSTTIENLDDATKDQGLYDMGIGANLQQVFGVNPFCWFAPCNLPLNRPVGDGVRWTQYYYDNIPEGP
ncbi:Palmitoyltransferase PFA3 [Babesia bigemina]|uniref:Palmitoyltransferase PFA3 n=1 Tax=Babesia bigemina TaxID=5866 RepID=A0A061D342_BABBI|nr:Palmitoyltransferase PFA3 [Babesia bigemina]CDR95033.1 Palmitoyltransferase PFA3 [Babesia bigemina]|eukprot:XP_012767219.1 Palmitoyltransferase PFA3 [Babesia bigemina]